ncbi:hypothetical protein C8A01DRAFT_34994 [Parachaetomium inaequale]|uniref:C2H2-type domain-containing protein n=1 Tax=Parachaetomium inaequale TaxID=2588326 RepID=A0AAN6PHP6_9PEZI|nr:hypothetical protein C8A01DRAFT_34994 [Parachaetomium inaequale]
MAETISSHVARCLALFRGLVEPSDGAELDFPDGVLLQITDEQSRFKVWSGNIGAHKTGMSSLDYRLRDASPIKSQVINLLKDLSQMTEDATAIARGEQTPWDQHGLEEDDQYSDSDDSPDTELGQIAVDMADVVNCLLRLTVTIRNPAPHDRYIQAKATDASHFEPFDIQHVRSKFDDIQLWLAERLGKAISRRRQYLRYRQSHHEKLAHGLDDAELDAGKTLEDQTVASSIPSHLKEGRVSTKAQPILTDDGSDAGMSQTSYATSMATSDKLTIPPLPKEAHAGPFQCCLCYMMIVARDRVAWKKHVYGDLQPYVCLERNCLTPEREYLRRHEWIAHVRQNHWKTYKCISCESPFSSSTDCKRHLETSHPAERSTAELDALVKLSEQLLNIRQGVSCPLCNETLRSVQQYQRHVGRHQEQLSLFALPYLEADGEAEGDEQDSDASDFGDLRREIGDDHRLRVDIPTAYPPPEAELEIREEEREAAHEDWGDWEENLAALTAGEAELEIREEQEGAHKYRDTESSEDDLATLDVGHVDLTAEELERSVAGKKAVEMPDVEMEEKRETIGESVLAAKKAAELRIRKDTAPLARGIRLARDTKLLEQVEKTLEKPGKPENAEDLIAGYDDLKARERGERIEQQSLDELGKPEEAAEGLEKTIPAPSASTRKRMGRGKDAEAERIARGLEESIAAYKAAEAQRAAREKKPENFTDKLLARDMAREAQRIQEEAEIAIALYNAWADKRFEEQKRSGDIFAGLDDLRLPVLIGRMRTAATKIRIETDKLRLVAYVAAVDTDNPRKSTFAERVGEQERELPEEEAEDAIVTADSISEHDSRDEDWAATISSAMHVGHSPRQAEDIVDLIRELQAEEAKLKRLEKEKRTGQLTGLENEANEQFEDDDKADEERQRRKDAVRGADQIEGLNTLDKLEKPEEAEEKELERIGQERLMGSGSDEANEALVVAHDLEGNEHMVPKGFNLSQDLGDFVTWYAEQEERLQKRKHEAEEERQATEDGSKIFIRLRSRANTADSIPRGISSRAVDAAEMPRNLGPQSDDLLQRFRRDAETKGLNESERLEREKAAEEAIAAYKSREAELIEEERQEGEAREADLKDRMKERLAESGMDEREIHSILLRNEKNKTEREAEDNNKNSGPVYTRMSLKHLEIATLLFYNIDFEEDQDPGYVLIRRWVPEWEQTMLWDHTRRFRMSKPGDGGEIALTRQGGRDKETTGGGDDEFVRPKPRRREEMPSRQEGERTAVSDDEAFKFMLSDPVPSESEEEWGRSPVKGAGHGEKGGTVVPDHETRVLDDFQSWNAKHKSDNLWESDEEGGRSWNQGPYQSGRADRPERHTR